MKPETCLLGMVVGLGGLWGCKTMTTTPNNTAASSTETSAPTTPPFQTFPIYMDSAPRHTHYAPSGYMGDSDLSMSGAYVQTPHGQGPCLRVTYRANGPHGWAGLYWQDPANNWGDVPGRAGFDLRGATKLTFWARGESGGEKVQKFRIGGIVGQYPDSDDASLENIRLSKEWKQYTIDLKKKDLRHIIAGFGFFLSKAENPGGMIFYLTDIVYEGPNGPAANTNVVVSTTVIETPTVTPATTTVEAPAPPPPSAPTSTKDLQVKETEEGLRVSFSSQFLFAPGRSTLEPGSSRVLDQLTGLLSAYPNTHVLVDGHTDNTGAAAFNLKLSELRATSVRDYLVKRGGFEANRFRVVGYGDTHPVADNKTAQGRALNRRVEVTILKSHA